MRDGLGKQVRAEAEARAPAGPGELSSPLCLNGRPGLGRTLSVAPEVCGPCPEEPGRRQPANSDPFLERARRVSQEAPFS